MCHNTTYNIVSGLWCLAFYVNTTIFDLNSPGILVLIFGNFSFSFCQFENIYSLFDLPEICILILSFINVQ